MKINPNLLSGLTLVAFLTALSFYVSHTVIAINLQLSALTIAILIGLILGNTFYVHIEKETAQGIQFAKTILLRTGIVLYGFRITLQDIHSVGVNAVISDALLLVTTFFLTCWIGIRLLKIDKQIVQLTAAGCSICGAAAIMATTSIVKAESHKVSVAVALIVIFGTLCMFLYPAFYPYLNRILNEHQFGIYIGSTVHEVAQVYAAGGNINSTVADTAVITKMIRVMMLAPFLIGLAYSLQQGNDEKKKITIPWFAVLFIAVAVFNSFDLIPEKMVNILIQIDTFLLMMTMSALGLTTRISSIKQAGIKPLLLGGIICLWLIVGGFFINLIMQFLFR